MTTRLTRAWREVSLRVRLVTVIVALLALALAAVGTTTTMLLRNYLLSELDEELTTTARGLDARTLEMLAGGAGQESGMPSDYFLQLRGEDGQTYTVASSSTLHDIGQPQLPTAANTDRGVGYSVGSEDGAGRWRAMTFDARDELGASGTLTVALPLRGVTRTTAQVTRLIVLTGLAITALGGLLAYFAVGRTLRPLRSIEQTAGAIASGDLSRRVPQEGANTEVGRLSYALNVMLAQIEQAFGAQAASEQRMRRFVSDASHELRTPLATVRGYGELYRMGAIPPEELPAAMSRVENEAQRMGDLVADLLTLARLDEGRRAEPSTIRLDVLATEAASDLRALDPTREVTLHIPNLPSEAWQLAGDEQGLRQVMSNLLGNVVAHTAAGSAVEIVLIRSPDVIAFEVRDHGPGIDAEHASRVFERFYRLDASRSRARGGSGLGLAIVAAVMAAHGGSAQMRPTPGGGTTARLELPAAPAPPSPSPGLPSPPPDAPPSPSPGAHAG